MGTVLITPWRKIPEALRRASALLRLVPFVLALLVVDARPGAAQWPEVERWFDGSQPITFGVESSRFRVSVIGSRPAIAVEDASSGNPPYRLIDTDLRGSGVSLDLKLRWPTAAATGTSGFGAVEPYFSFGPILGQSGSKSDGAMALGLSMGAGLSWRFARNAELFGGYRFMQYGRDSVFSRGERSLSDPDATGHDFLYGISVRF